MDSSNLMDFFKFIFDADYGDQLKIKSVSTTEQSDATTEPTGSSTDITSDFSERTKKELEAIKIKRKLKYKNFFRILILILIGCAILSLLLIFLQFYEKRAWYAFLYAFFVFVNFIFLIFINHSGEINFDSNDPQNKIDAIINTLSALCAPIIFYLSFIPGISNTSKNALIGSGSVLTFLSLLFSFYVAYGEFDTL